MQSPDKQEIRVSPLRVLIDPTALPREGFRVDRKVGLLNSGVEAGFAAAAIYLVVSAAPEVGVLLYIAMRSVATISTHIARLEERMRKK